MYCHLAGKDYLEGAHSSIVDAFAQSYIVGHECFVEFWDKPVGIVEMQSVWETKRRKRMEQEAELTRQLPNGWDQMCTGWKLPQRKSYSGPEGGPKHGHSAAMITVTISCSLSKLFMFYIPNSLLDMIANETNC